MDAQDDWQEAALTTRHMHNRNDRGGRGNTRETFEIRNTFGTHLVKCPALERLQTAQEPATTSRSSGKAKQTGGGKKKAGRSNSGSGDVVLDIYRLADGEEGILGSLTFPGVFEASVVFAGSRKVLGNVTRELVQEDAAKEEPPYGKRRGSEASSNAQRRKVSATNGAGGDDESEESDEEDEDDDDDDEEYSEAEDGLDRHQRRAATFEKNSFRQPKFWFRWQGRVSDNVLAERELEGSGTVHGSGYVVFSGNDCRRFQGTMTSEAMGWNNVKMTGWKAKPQPERDFEIQWSQEA